MRAEEICVGQKVRVVRREREYVGWVSEMDEYLGKEYIVASVDAGIVRLKGISWAWNPKSFDPVDELTEPTEEEFMSVLFCL